MSCVSEERRSEADTAIDRYREAVREETLDEVYEVLNRIEGTPGTDILLGWIRSELGHLNP